MKSILAVVAMVAVSGFAFAQTPTIEPIVDMPSYINAFFDALSPVIAAVVGVFVGILVVRKGMQWARKAG